MPRLTSVLVQITPALNATTTIQQIKDVVATHLDGKRIKDRDNILNTLSTIHSHQRGLTYVYNSLLKYEGLGLR